MTDEKRIIFNLSAVEQINKCEMKCILDPSKFGLMIGKRCKIRFINGEFISKYTTGMPAFLITSDLMLFDSTLMSFDYSYDGALTETITKRR